MQSKKNIPRLDDGGQDLVIIGAGGHAVSVASVAISTGFKIRCFIDKNKYNTELLKIEVINDLTFLENINTFSFSIAVGDNYLRQKIYEEMTNKYGELKYPAIVHSSAVLSKNSEIKSGVVIMPNAVVGPNTIVEKFCILNTQSALDHDCSIGKFSSMAPAAITGGSVKIGSRTAISMGARIKQSVQVGDDTVLGANSFLNRNIGNNILAYGTPARVIRRRESDEPYLD